MSGRRTIPPRELGLYVRELRLSLRNNAGAYGYSVMITSVMAMLTALLPSPRPGQIMLFIVGAVGSFAAIEAIATRGFTRSFDDQEATRVVALGSSLNLVSIAVSVAAAAMIGLVLPATVAWLVAPSVASLTYLLLTAVEMTVARRVEEFRNFE